ncbi:MAG: DUF1838 family protein [Chloroflexota bacterium]|nr:DUF1838 domain-containing protein [Dehalococcoidia bacterium]MDW8253187.1 DUF1838 family protein [Chloroflexota bacterium]
MGRLDLNDPETNLRAFVRARGTLGPEVVTYWFAGNVYSFIPGERSRHLFGFEGFNIGRVTAAPGGYYLLTREAVFYKDPTTGAILDRWTNPWTGKEVEVVHVLNDPVNQHLQLEGPRGRWHIPVTEMGDDVYMNTDIFLHYPSPLPRSKFPQYSASDEYQAAELFQFYMKRHDLEDESLLSVPSQCSWTRLGPWLPWMEMADRPGMVVYHCRGKKLEGGYAQLPDFIKEYIAAHHPEYQDAPHEYTQPNETSWTYFLKLLQRRGLA